MLIEKEIKTQSNSIFWSMLLMIVTVLVSRAALSISIILFCLVAILRKDFRNQVVSLYKAPLLVGICLLFVVPFISGLWSANYQQWIGIIQLKLPFLFLPLAFAGSWNLTERQWRILLMFIVLIVLFGCIWSALDYLLHLKQYHEAYLKAKLISTSLENDHVRFSWLAVVAIMLCFFLYEHAYRRKSKLLLSVISFLLILYVHLLAARLGLVCLYLFLISFAAWKGIRQHNSKWIFLLATVILLPLITWFTFPTFKNRIKYFAYDINEVVSGNYYPGSNDGARFLSMKAGWYIMNDKPLGAGAGDLKTEANSWYIQNAKGLPLRDRFYPSNEWLIYGGYAGWAGFIMFTGIMCIPFLFPPPNHKVYWYVFNVMALLSFIIDMGLEVQYGIFLYSFLLLCLNKYFNPTVND